MDSKLGGAFAFNAYDVASTIDGAILLHSTSRTQKNVIVELIMFRLFMFWLIYAANLCCSWRWPEDISFVPLILESNSGQLEILSL